jgi:hypothetical protein
MLPTWVTLFILAWGARGRGEEKRRGRKKILDRIKVLVILFDHIRKRKERWILYRINSLAAGFTTGFITPGFARSRGMICKSSL